MAITGALAAAARIHDPWPQFDEVYDFAGVRDSGRAYFKLPGGRVVRDLRAVPNTTFTRATTAIVRDADGTLREVASGEPAVGRGRGIEFFPIIQNKSSSHNANPPSLVAPTDAASFVAATAGTVNASGSGALFSIVDDSSAMRAGKLWALLSKGVLNGRVVCIDNSAGAGVAQCRFVGSTGNTNPHGFICMARGSGQASIGASTTQGDSTALGSDYAPISAVVTPGSGQLCQVTVSAGSIGYFILWTMAEGAYVPPIVPVAGSTAFRNADDHVRSRFAPNPRGMTFYFEGTFEARLENSYAYEVSNGGSGERFLIQSNTSDIIRLTIISSAGGTDFVAGPTLLTAAKLKAAARWNGSIWDLVVNGVKYTNAGADTLPSGLNQFNLGQRLNGAEKEKGAQAVFARADRAIPDAEILALTTL
jgi:hypothetical protein